MSATSQRELVRASLLADSQRETHRDVYGRRRPRVANDPVSRQAVTRQIRELGVLLDAAADDRAREWLVLRLRNRLSVLTVMLDRGGSL